MDRSSKVLTYWSRDRQHERPRMSLRECKLEAISIDGIAPPMAGGIACPGMTGKMPAPPKKGLFSRFTPLDDPAFRAGLKHGNRQKRDFWLQTCTSTPDKTFENPYSTAATCTRGLYPYFSRFHSSENLPAPPCRDTVSFLTFSLHGDRGLP